MTKCSIILSICLFIQTSIYSSEINYNKHWCTYYMNDQWRTYNFHPFSVALKSGYNDRGDRIIDMQLLYQSSKGLLRPVAIRRLPLEHFKSIKDVHHTKKCPVYVELESCIKHNIMWITYYNLKL